MPVPSARFTSTTIAFDLDTNPSKRSYAPAYNGCVPDGKRGRLKVFLLMITHVMSTSMGLAFLLKQKRQARAVRKRTWRLARPCTCCTGRVAATFTTGCRPRARQADFQHPNCAAKSPQSPFSPTVHTRPPFGCHMREVQNLIPGEMMRGEKGGG